MESVDKNKRQRKTYVQKLTLLIIVFFAIISTASTPAQKFRNVVETDRDLQPELIQLIAKEFVH